MAFIVGGVEPQLEKPAKVERPVRGQDLAPADEPAVEVEKEDASLEASVEPAAQKPKKVTRQRKKGNAKA